MIAILQSVKERANRGNIGKSGCSSLPHCLAVFVDSWDSRSVSLTGFFFFYAASHFMVGGKVLYH